MPTIPHIEKHFTPTEIVRDAHSANRPAMAMPCSTSHARTLLPVAARACVGTEALSQSELGEAFLLISVCAPITTTKFR